MGAVLVLAGAVVVAARATDAGPAEVDVAPDPGRWTQGRVRVEVLNAGELSGMARIATERLRDAGFDVVDYRNADRFDHARPSEVVDRVGRTDAARAVAEALGIGIVHSDPDPNLYVDVSVVLGRDWTGAEPDPVETVQDSPPWWNPRSWTKR